MILRFLAVPGLHSVLCPRILSFLISLLIRKPNLGGVCTAPKTLNQTMVSRQTIVPT